MFIVAFFENTTFLHLNLLRAVDDEDMAQEVAYQYALKRFGHADNIDVFGPDAELFAKLDMPNFVHAFTDKQVQTAAFIIFAVKYLKSSNKLF